MPLCENLVSSWFFKNKHLTKLVLGIRFFPKKKTQLLGLENYFITFFLTKNRLWIYFQQFINPQFHLFQKLFQIFLLLFEVYIYPNKILKVKKGFTTNFTIIGPIFVLKN
jgi:hypothetical protein